MPTPGNAFAIARVGDPLGEGREVVLLVGHLDVGEQLAALADQGQAPAQQIAGGAHARRVHVGLGQHPAAQQHGDLQGVDAVVLRLAAVDRLHVEGVAEDEGDAFGGAEVGKPVPGEDALDGHDEALAIRSDRLQKRFGVRRQVLVDEHLAVAGLRFARASQLRGGPPGGVRWAHGGRSCRVGIRFERRGR